MIDGFDGVFKRSIDFENFIVDVIYNPYADEWTFIVGKLESKFEGVTGRMVYELLSTMKWLEEHKIEKQRRRETEGRS